MRVESQSRSIPMTGSVVIKHMPSQVTLLMNESSTSIDKLWLFVQLPLHSVAEKEQHSCNQGMYNCSYIVLRTYVQMQTHTYTHTHTHTCTNTHTCTCTHTYTHTHTHTNACMHVRTRTRVHTQTHTLHNTITHVRT